jgi:hypothetical protein
MNHVEILKVIIGYSMVGFFVACLVAGVLHLFGKIELDKQVKNYLFGTLLVSFGGIVIAYLADVIKTPSELRTEIENKVTSEVRQEVEEIRAKPAEVIAKNKTVYIQVAHREQRERAAQLQERLKANGFLAPGIENAWNRSPNRLQVRYFPDDLQLANQVADLLTAEGIGTPQMVKLDIGGRTSGAIEVWFPR